MNCAFSSCAQQWRWASKQPCLEQTGFRQAAREKFLLERDFFDAQIRHDVRARTFGRANFSFTGAPIFGEKFVFKWLKNTMHVT